MTDKVLLAVAGVIGLGTLAYFYEAWNKKTKKKYIDFDKKVKSMKTLRGADGNFQPQAVAKLVTYVNEESEKEFARASQTLARQRRKVLKENDYDEYLELAQESLDLQKEIEEEYLKRALDKLGVEREEYEEELAKLPPQTLQMIMASKSAPKPTEGVALHRSLTKSRTKEIFLEITRLQERANEKWKDLFDKLEALVGTMDQMTGGGIMMGVMQLLVTDILQCEYGVSEEQYTAALQQHRIMEDPEIVRMMQQKQAMYQMMMMMNGGQ